MTLPDVAARLGLTPAEAAVHLLVATRLRASCVFAQPPTNSPDSVRALLRHRAHVGGSDAIYAPVGGGGRPHPRGWGAFARFLAEHVRTLGDWTWHDAVTHLSTRPAERFALAGRGVVAPGAVADLALVDPDRVRDEATYEDPRRPASGVDDVLVAGVPVLRDGSLTDALAGRPLRPGAGASGPAA
jgi:N-acyl-D-amino-acid deacylase